MKRTLGVASTVVIGVLAFGAWQARFVEAQAPAGRGGAGTQAPAPGAGGRGGAAAAETRAKQEAAEKAAPQLQITEEILPLVMPDHTMGETEGVSLNSKGHLFVYSRTGKGRERARRDGRGALRVRPDL